MADSPLPTQNPITTSIDEKSCSAQYSAQWFVDKYKFGAPTQGNELSFFICGEEGFRSIMNDLRKAKGSVDLILWGFDPGMELEREGTSVEWPRGPCYGEIVEEIAKKGVKVRMLIWYNKICGWMLNNLIGYTDTKTHLCFSPTYASRKRHEYCYQWWKRNLEQSKNSNLTILFRDVSIRDAVGSLSVDPEEIGEIAATEHIMQEGFASHHQKPILIDYDYEEGSEAVGYVMGLNSVTEFWDTKNHEFDESKRELWPLARSDSEQKHEGSTEGVQFNNRDPYLHVKPYRDYACRVTGPVLAQLHLNFENGWNAALGRPLPDVQTLLTPPSKIKGTGEDDPAYVAQIVRTQPHEQDKSIKQLYLQSTSFARHYIYIENQYFFYPEFARHIKKTREAFCKGWKKCNPLDQLPMLHIFVVIPHPESDFMVPRTADTLTELGHSDDMLEQQKLADQALLTYKYEDSHPVEVTVSQDDAGNDYKRKGYVLDRPSVEDLQKTMGLNVSIARLRTSGPAVKNKEAEPDPSGSVKPTRYYREIYIHSKIMLIDDVFVTLGSANLNQRSMASDSEINIGAQGPKWVKPLRKGIFENLGKVKWEGDFKLLPEIFDDWNAKMDKNKKSKKDGEPLAGFLLPFEDHRSTTLMVG